ncbi:flagellar protein FlaG [Anaerosolibacter carboniphilus]|uniref:Flagellar protein FlaG n=1 Tax=Anaerosolibacter carboniphilus TaxID=1417629 RepID=A0A841KWQ1_9FIRM|nr:flagellar protein FlaG [Anaerosolibacter carboniphilus]MBB6216440.1 flagellar protein FlaG [Anaerosolibacter carboniphilus]
MRIESSISNAVDINSPNQRQGQASNGQQGTGEGEIVQAATSNFPGEKQLIAEIERANKDLNIKSTNLKFSIHEKTKAILVKVVDSETKEVVREIPSEKILDMVASMLERTGLFVDKKI